MPAGGWPWRLLALAVFVTLVCVRIPGLLHHPRFWAEEGAVYYRRAWIMPWWQALWSPYVGYLNLVANAATLAARYLVAMRSAPRVTTEIALAVQAIPAVLLVTARDAWLRRPSVVFAALLILAMPPVCGEVWLNSINSQCHLALAAGLCLALEVPAGAAAIGRGVLLFLVPLTSPGSIAFTPLFVARAAIERGRGRAIEAACMSAGAGLQLAVVYSPFGHRGQIPGPAILSSIFAVKHLAIPFLGHAAADLIADDLHADILAGQAPVAAMLAVGLVAGLLVAAVGLRRHPAPAWLLASGAAIACLSYYGALEGGAALITVIGGERYAFAPSMLFALSVLALAATGTDRIAQAAWVAVAWLLAISLQQTILPQDSMFVEGPNWKTELSHWRADPTHPLAIWPAGWSIALPRETDRH